MYRTCIYCKKALGSNEVVEEFPVGRRLAFDAAKGRLWVVCRRCERWNLSPLEERWEAVETCEKLFRGTRVRVSSENIGLARHPEGLELVRIGKPLRPEFAAWRYGDQFGTRARRRSHRAWHGGWRCGPSAAWHWAVRWEGLIGVGRRSGRLSFNRIEQLEEASVRRFSSGRQDGRLRWMNRTSHSISARLVPADDESGFSVEAKARGVVSARGAVRGGGRGACSQRDSPEGQCRGRFAKGPYRTPSRRLPFPGSQIDS